MDEHAILSIRWIPALPLLGGALSAVWLVFAKRSWPPALVCLWHVGAPLAAFASSVWLTWDLATRFGPGDRFLVDELRTWISAGGFQADLTLRLDPLSAVFALAISAVATLVHLYAIGFSGGARRDSDLQRLLSVSNLLLGAVLVLFLVDDLTPALLAWQALALIGSGLGGFQLSKPFRAAAAGRFAIVQRVGDLTLVLALLALFWSFGGPEFPSLEYAQMRAASAPPAEIGIAAGPGESLPGEAASPGSVPTAALTLAGFLLLISVAIKAQQLPFPEWRSSSLTSIPAAALLQALCLTLPPVYLLSRVSFVFEQAPLAAAALAWCGILTGLIAGIAAVYARDLRRAFAYSSAGHLGIALAAAGVGAYGAAIFYALGHSLVRTLLLLSGGSIVLELGGQTRLDRMGGQLKSLPWTHAVFVAGSAALLFLPLTTAGQIRVSQPLPGLPALAAVAGLAVAALALHTALLYLRISTGRPRVSHRVRSGHPEGESLLVFAMAALGALTLFTLGVAGLPDPVGEVMGVERSNSLRHFLAPVFGADSDDFNSRIALYTVMCSVAGVAAAFLSERKRWRGGRSWIERLAPLLGRTERVQRLDVLATRWVVRPLVNAARAVQSRIETGLYVRGGVRGARLARNLAQGLATRAQGGLLQSYLVGGLVAAALLLAYVLRGA